MAANTEFKRVKRESQTIHTASAIIRFSFKSNGLYACRTAGRDRHHWHSRGAATSRSAKSSSRCATSSMRKQLAPNRFGDAQSPLRTATIAVCHDLSLQYQLKGRAAHHARQKLDVDGTDPALHGRTESLRPIRFYATIIGRPNYQQRSRENNRAGFHLSFRPGIWRSNFGQSRRRLAWCGWTQHQSLARPRIVVSRFDRTNVARRVRFLR